MPDFKELVKNLYTSKNRELTEDKLKYIETNYKGKETEFVKNFYATIGEELPKEKFDYISNTYLKKKVGTETSTSTSTSKTDNTELAPKSGSLESPSPIKKFEGFSQSDLKKLGGPKKTAQEIPVLPENLKKVINDPENIARVNNLKKQELAKFRESTSINELDNQDIKNEFLAKQNNEGLLNKAKAAAQSLGGFLTSGSFGSTDLLIDEKKEARNQLIKQGIKKPSEEEVLKVAENIFTKKKSEGLKKDKISNYLENLDPAIKTILGADAEVKYKTLDKENTKVLNRMATNKVAFESYLDDLENPNLLPKDRVIIEQLRDETAKQLDKDLKLFNSNTDKVGSLKEEFEVFKKNYDTMENLAMRVGTSIADAGVNLLSGTGYLSSLNPGDVLGQIRNIQTQEIVNKAKANLNEIKSQYRPESEELTTDNWANYVTDVMANQSGTLLTMATTGGVGGATLLGVGGAGEKYNEIYNENKKGAGYSPLQMAVTPFLSGVSTGILSELPTAKTLMGTKRLFTAAINEGKKEVIDQAIKQTSKKIAKEVLDNYKREIPTELLDNLVQNTIDKDILGKDVGYWDNTWKTLKDTAIMTTVFSSGALPHVALAGVKMFTKPEQNKMLDDNGKKIIELSKQLNNPNLDETSRKVIENQIDKATIENSQIVNSTLDKIANLPDADVKKVVDNNRKEIKIKQEANVVKENESIEPNTKKIILDGLKNDYIQTVEQTKSIIDAEAKPQEVVEQKSETQPKTKEQEKVAEVENVSLTNEENKPTSIEKTEANTTEKVNIKESKNQKNSFGNNLPKDQKRFDITNKGSVEGEILLKEVKYKVIMKL
jgi:hypothetical protein